MITQYLLLFGSAFLAATILPFYSEIYLFLLVENGYSPSILFIVATAGNTAGAIVNWILGRYLLHFQDRKWFYFNQQQMEKAQNWYRSYGIWTLLFAWLPIGGDGLTLVAGIMRARLFIFIILVAIGKGLRYWVVIFFATDMKVI